MLYKFSFYTIFIVYLFSCCTLQHNQSLRPQSSLVMSTQSLLQVDTVFAGCGGTMAAVMMTEPARRYRLKKHGGDGK